MSKTSYVFVNGINTSPGNVNNWNHEASSWVDKNTKHRGDHYEYKSDAIFRRIHQEERVKDLQVVVQRLAQGDIILVGHSNGCDLIERLVKRNVHKFKEIHLIAGASEADFRKNGFNDALRIKAVDRIFIYKSEVDGALKQAKWSTRLFGWMGLGYGYIGLVGPKYVSKELGHRVTVVERLYSHSEWFNGDNFNDTMKLVTHTT